MKTFAILLSVFSQSLFLGIWQSSVASDQLQGVAEVIDADTLIIAGSTIHLQHVDALEPGQVCRQMGKEWSCGDFATNALRQFITGKIIQCRFLKTRLNGELSGRCSRGNLDLGAEMINRGFAIRHPASTPDYRFAEREARNRGAGIWSGLYVRPELWRQGKRLKAHN